MLLLGAALSVGGVTEAFDRVHFVVQKDLDGVQVVRKSPAGERVVADVREGLTGNSIYKIAGMVPDRFVVRSSELMKDGLFADPILPPFLLRPRREAEAVVEIGEPEIDFALLSRQVREEFFLSMPFGNLIREKSEKYDVDPALVAAVIENESRFKPRARSHKGARGLMQLMPRTGAWMGARNLYDPEQNVDAGVKYLKYLEKRFDGNRTKIIAAYNAGEGNVMRYGGIPPFRETRSYVKNVMKSYERNSRELEEFEKKALASLELTP
ncbi:MAG TPA: lytic transglycosylase domain-containing protein [Thermoanaerobaculia bacterium]|nr:lytic transglycosylase domain-containing protein [Thermoanaerobaculia bacterium]